MTLMSKIGGVTKTQRKKVLLVINPCAGKNSKRVGALDIMNRLSSADFDFEVRNTRCQGDATTIVKEIGENYDMVICCGGDGTLNEAVNGLMKLNKRIPIGYIPSGSTNDLAATLGIPTKIDEAAELILSEKLNSYDVGEFNGRFFNYVASFGLGVEVSYSTPQAMKNLLGHWAYMINAFVLKLIPMLSHLKPVHMKVEYDGNELEDDFYFGSFSNSTSVAGLFKFNQDEVKLNDGCFELLLVRGLKRKSEAFSMLGKIIRQEYDGERIMLIKAKNVKITCDEEIPWTLDGEFGGNHKNIELSVNHRGFDIYSDNDRMFIKE